MMHKPLYFLNCSALNTPNGSWGMVKLSLHRELQFPEIPPTAVGGIPSSRLCLASLTGLTSYDFYLIISKTPSSLKPLRGVAENK
jgi:hypothetical protein